MSNKIALFIMFLFIWVLPEDYKTNSKTIDYIPIIDLIGSISNHGQYIDLNIQIEKRRKTKQLTKSILAAGWASLIVGGICSYSWFEKSTELEKGLLLGITGVGLFTVAITWPIKSKNNKKLVLLEFEKDREIRKIDAQKEWEKELIFLKNKN